ncbi:hypothetical protein [Bacillus sp. SJS]|uniref:hypothetical protein n=1 Tax=Bacillus sp. SJS TaxID=1423321 RepID=UPI0004DD0295|nr:hypothetical protein [Bacillus sp. SJS]KZZ85127.1 hypothetical protein AS29_008755 [Bacillus sp. SJS]
MNQNNKRLMAILFLFTLVLVNKKKLLLRFMPFGIFMVMILSMGKLCRVSGGRNGETIVNISFTLGPFLYRMLWIAFSIFIRLAKLPFWVKKRFFTMDSRN